MNTFRLCLQNPRGAQVQSIWACQRLVRGEKQRRRQRKWCCRFALFADELNRPVRGSQTCPPILLLRRFGVAKGLAVLWKSLLRPATRAVVNSLERGRVADETRLGGGLWHPETTPTAAMRAAIDQEAQRLKAVLMEDELRRQFLNGAPKQETKVVQAFVSSNAENALKTKPKVSNHRGHAKSTLLLYRIAWPSMTQSG